MYRNHDFGEVRMTVLGHYRGSANCLDVVRGIVLSTKTAFESLQKVPKNSN